MSSTSNRPRVLKRATEEKDGLIHYQGKPFTGALFTVKDDTVSAREIKDGKDAGPYRNEYFDTPETGLDAEHPDLDGNTEYEQLKLKDKPYNGITYEFYDAALHAEVWYVDGWPVHELRWHPNGQLNAYEFWEPSANTNANYYFDDNGKMSMAHIRKGKDIEMTVRFDDEYKLKELRLKPGYFTTKNEIVEAQPFHTITSAEELSSIPCGESLWLSDDGITDEIFALFDLAATTDFSMHYTALTTKTIERLAAMRHVKRAHMTDPHGNNAEALVALKKKHPDIKVHYRCRF